MISGQGLELSHLPVKRCARSLEGHSVPDFVVRVLLQQHGDEIVDAETEADGEVYSLDMRKICRSRACELLQMSKVGRVCVSVCLCVCSATV